MATAAIARHIQKAPEVTSPTKNTPGLLPTPPTKPRFRHLSGPELDEWRDKCLCFNCDQKWSKQHKYGARVFLMLAGNDDLFSIAAANKLLVNSIDPGRALTPQSEVQAAQLSLLSCLVLRQVIPFGSLGISGHIWCMSLLTEAARIILYRIQLLKYWA